MSHFPQSHENFNIKELICPPTGQNEMNALS